MEMKSKSRIKSSGEVFTPRSLIHEMLEKIPNEVWFYPFKTWLEPSAGDGNFLVEIKARLMQAGHKEKHILDHMIYGIELIDDNHWVLQHRLGYFKDGKPNSTIWSAQEIAQVFTISKIHPLAQDLNQSNPYHLAGLCEKDEVLHHRNMVCTSVLEYNMSFNRTQAQQEADEKLRGILPGFEVEITEEHLLWAFEQVEKRKFNQHGQTDHAFYADVLMQLAETPFYESGFQNASGFNGIDCSTSSLIPGILEIKTYAAGPDNCDFIAIYNRDFSKDALAEKIKDDIFNVIGSKLKFTLKEVKKVSTLGNQMEVVISVLPVIDLGQWPETDTPDIGEKTVVEKILGSSQKLRTY